MILLGRLLLDDGKRGKADRHLVCSVFCATWYKRHQCQCQIRHFSKVGGIHYNLRQMKEASFSRAPWDTLNLQSYLGYFVLLFFSGNGPLMNSLLLSLSSLLSVATQTRTSFLCRDLGGFQAIEGVLVAEQPGQWLPRPLQTS